MRNNLIKLSLSDLELAKKVTDDYPAYKQNAELSMWDPIPIESSGCRHLGEFLVKLGNTEEADYELIGIGQSLINQANALNDAEISNEDTDEEIFEKFKLKAMSFKQK